ncbi:MAG: hypothetical protein LBG06_03370 [Deltaproteobacteria bacterium]|jgi:hypothetical protein|nr:hypothetical protein [Deltaproteobacteria bacterium]
MRPHRASAPTTPLRLPPDPPGRPPRVAPAPAAGLAAALLAAALALAVPAAAQPPPPVPAPGIEDSPAAREMVHLGALGAYSAGFVLEAYGYIGLLADVLHHGVYEPEIVKSMLGETRIFLQKAMDKLAIYRSGAVTVKPDDLAFINGIADILTFLIAEADGLAAYCDGFAQEDFERFRESRAKAWALIKQHLGIK